MKEIVVFGGRFQPPHKGHKASFDWLVNKFGGNSVYMASADKAPGPKDPFTWEEKKRIAVAMGVPTGKFVQVKNVYVDKFIKDAIPFNPADTVLILALSQKDGDRLVSTNTDEEGYALKKNGERAAIQWLRKDAQPVSSGHMYAYATPTVTFPVAGKKITGATEIRDMYAVADSKTRNRILTDLYGEEVGSKVRKQFDKSMGMVQTEDLVREFAEFLNNFNLRS